jgi:hypothetical protein
VPEAIPQMWNAKDYSVKLHFRASMNSVRSSHTPGSIRVPSSRNCARAVGWSAARCPSFLEHTGADVLLDRPQKDQREITIPAPALIGILNDLVGACASRNLHRYGRGIAGDGIAGTKHHRQENEESKDTHRVLRAMSVSLNWGD